MVRVYGLGEQVVVTYLKELSPRLLEERGWTKSRGISAPCRNSSFHYHCTALTVPHNEGKSNTQCGGSIQCPSHFGPLYTFFCLYVCVCLCVCVCVCVIFKQTTRCPTFFFRNIKDNENLSMYIRAGGTAVAQWLRYCAKNWEVASSIPDGVNGIFH
jgi:hypothetical protein